MDNQTAAPQSQMAALRTVMAQRGMSTGVLDQVNPQQAAQPAVTQQQALPMAPQGQQAQTPNATPQVPQGTGLPANNPEALVITKALIDRQKFLGKTGQ